jgi:hypothetical protein
MQQLSYQLFSNPFLSAASLLSIYSGTLVSCPVVAEHFTVVGGIIPMIAAGAACCGGWLIASSSLSSPLQQWRGDYQQLREYFSSPTCISAASLLWRTNERCGVLPVARAELAFVLSSPVALCFASNSAFSLPVHQGLVVFTSSYIAKGPISLLEVMGCLSHCHNLYHVHQSNALFLVYMLLVFLLAFHMVIVPLLYVNLASCNVVCLSSFPACLAW